MGFGFNLLIRLYEKKKSSETNHEVKIFDRNLETTLYLITVGKFAVLV